MRVLTNRLGQEAVAVRNFEEILSEWRLRLEEISGELFRRSDSFGDCFPEY